MSDVPRNLALSGSTSPSASRFKSPLPSRLVAAGVLEAAYTAPVDADVLVERAFIKTNSTTPTALSVYVGDPVDENEVSYAPAGDLNEAEWNPAIWVPAGDTVRFRWEGGTAPADAQLQGRANVQGWRIPIVSA